MGMQGAQSQTGFKQTQQSYQRVKNAYHEKADSMLSLLSRFEIESNEIELYIQVFKREQLFEIWARKKGDGDFIKLKSYDICQSSGVLGPKRKQGDLQVPEGFYSITAFNPWSNFHLSMCINYPNHSDRILGVQGSLGGDICIHGSCVTIGCIPLTDEVIKEVYLLCVEARNNGQNQIPVTIYPAKLNKNLYDLLCENNSEDEDKVNLWSDLRNAFDYFNKHHRIPEISFLKDGRHAILNQRGNQF